ncbi:MAG TPA: protein kinase [Vicinamibacterales bacterium]|nr:protein kinase [Vicinamibacterales bacterium]
MSEPEANPPDDQLARLARALVDHESIDWEAASVTSSAPALVAQLKVLASLFSSPVVPPSLPSSWIPEGESWGPLVLLEKVGRGSYGEVYRAWDRRLDREVALKLLLVPTDATTADGVIDEGRLLARVRHPNVVTVYGAEQFDGRIGIWTEFIRGATLSDLVRANGPFTASDAAAIGLHVCSALTAVHAAGLLHRDIKAQNVMRAEDGRIVLMDFGAGQRIDFPQYARRNTRVGTPLYVAPELWRGSPASHHTDVFAVGVLLYHLATGEYPIYPDVLPEFTEVDRCRPVDPDSLTHRPPTAFWRVVAHALRRKPADRLESAGAFAVALAEASKALNPARRERSRRQQAFWASGAVLTGVIGALVWSASPATRAPDREEFVRLEVLCNQACEPSPDGRYLTRSIDGDLWLWDTQTARNRRLTEMQARALGGGVFPAAVISHDGRRIAYAWRSPAGEQMLETMEIGDAAVRTVLPLRPSPRPVPVQFTRDGEKLLCWLDDDHGGHDLALVTIASGHVQVLGAFLAPPHSVSLSPDDRFVVYDQPSSQANRNWDLFVASTRDGQARVLLQHPANDVRPFWMPGGAAVVFTSDRSGALAEWMVEVRNGNALGEPRLAAPLSAGARPFALTNDRSLFFWLSTTDRDVYVQPLDRTDAGSAPAQRVDPLTIGGHSQPVWSPDGHFLAYIAQGPTGDERLVLVDRRSGNRKSVPLALSEHEQHGGAWSPDGRCIALTGTDVDGRHGIFCVDVTNGKLEPLWIDANRRRLPADFEWMDDGQALLYGDQRGVIARNIRSGQEDVLCDIRGTNLASAARVHRAPFQPLVAYTAQAGDGAAARQVLVAQPLHGAPRVLVTGDRDERIAVQGVSRDGTDIFFTRFSPPLAPPTLMYRLFAVSVHGGASRSMHLSIPGFTWEHDVSIDPAGTAIAFDHFSHARLAELWVLRRLSHPFD